MEDILQAVGQILAPNQPLDFFLYAIFILAIAMSFFIPDKNVQPSMLMGIVILCVIIDKVTTSPFGGQIPIPGFDGGFGTMLIRVGMAILPFMSAGLVRTRGRQSKAAIPLGIVTGIVGSVYLIIFMIELFGRA